MRESASEGAVEGVDGGVGPHDDATPALLSRGGRASGCLGQSVGGRPPAEGDAAVGDTVPSASRAEECLIGGDGIGVGARLN